MTAHLEVGATIVPVVQPLLLAVDGTERHVIAMSPHGATMRYLVTDQAGPPVWVDERDVSTSEVAETM
jgi:hypothetical protein